MNSVRIGNKQVVPSKIVCIGRNYTEHIEELNNAIPEQMVVFNKPNSSLSLDLKSFDQEPLHYEAEICFLVDNGRFSAVAFGLDLTKRELQTRLKKQGLPWERAKAFDGAAVLSRFVPIDAADIDSLSVELFINCVRVQRGDVSQMLYSPQNILSELRSYTHLEDNDVVMTGTPKGVGQICRGDLFLGRIKLNDKTLVEVEWVAV